MVVDLAEEIATDEGLGWVVPRHLLAALLRTSDAPGYQVLHSLGANLTPVLEYSGHFLPAKGTSTEGRPRHDPTLQKVLALAHVVASRREKKDIGSEDLLLALVRADRFEEARVLDRAGITALRVEGGIRVFEAHAHRPELGALLVALMRRQGSLDFFALQLLHDVPFARLSASVRSTTEWLIAELSAELTERPPGLVPPHGLSEAIAQAWSLAHERREPFDRVHLLASLAEFPNTAWATVVGKLGDGKCDLFTLLRP